jgi:hypothetical protein
MTSHQEMLEETFKVLYKNFDMFLYAIFVIKVCVSIKRLKFYLYKEGPFF